MIKSAGREVLQIDTKVKLSTLPLTLLLTILDPCCLPM